ncbi:MAG: KpsF/GutQ family sugar-phosphate isomerase [Elusimicrobiales bacterium]
MAKPKNSPQSVTALARADMLAESRAVASAARALDGAVFSRAVRILRGALGRVAVTGLGKSGLIGRKIAATLSSTGTSAVFVHPVECLHGDLGMISEGDVLLALSSSGETDEVCKLAALLKSRGVKVAALTAGANSRLARISDAGIALKISGEACPHNITPTSSTTAMLAAGDALALALMRLSGFGREDFARLHPGGSLGKMLSLRVRDLMRTGAANPVMLQTKTVADALPLMTETRLGAVSVVDSKGRLAGFFTDGDLRRGLQKDTALLSRKLADVMTRKPAFVTADTPAIEAARLLSGKKIDNIPVLDGRGRPAGVLDEQDLIDVLPLVRDEQ